MSNKNELDFIKYAIKEARRSRSEDGRNHPRVGVVIVKDGDILASACRGDLGPGDHAEYTALEKKLRDDSLAGCTVYTTLEPCTTRNHPKVPCADRLIERRVGRVVIGMLDPDQRITGGGILRLRRAGIAVDLFPPKQMAELEELNREFIRDRETEAGRSQITGINEAGISAFFPSRDFYNHIRRDTATIDRYVATANQTLRMVSVNLMTGLPFNELCTAIETRLRLPGDEFTAEISLLDPRQPELMATMAPLIGQEPPDLAQNIRRSLRELCAFRARLDDEMQARLDVRVHKVIPFGSAILLDDQRPDGRIQIETKPYRAGLQKSFAFEVVRTGDGGFFDVLSTAYRAVLDEGDSVVTLEF